MIEPGTLRACATFLALLLLAWRAAREGQLRGARVGRLAALAALAVPWENFCRAHADPLLQQGTAAVSALLVGLTGLPVQLISQSGQPHLLTAHADVHVSNLCAGLTTLVTLTTLGLILAEAFLPDARHPWRFVALTPLIGFGANVVRIVLSTHAANLWAHNADAWALAHAAIGYTTFACTYGALFALVWRQRHRRTA